MIKSLRALTQPDFQRRKQFQTPSNKNDHSRDRFFSQNFKKSPFIHNRFSAGHFNEEKSPRKIVTEQQQQEKPFFRLPKITKQPLKDEQLDDVSLKIVKMKKFFYDPYGCSKSAKLEKVKIRKKIMGIGPQNKMILQQFELKNRKIKAVQQASKQEEQKYKMKIYGC